MLNAPADGATSLSDRARMREAMELADLAAAHGDVPVGALVVVDGRVIGRGRNQTEQLQDPTAHAEMLAIRAAAKETGYCRLSGATLYVTLEPCAMCAGAIVLARISRVVFGAVDPKTGAAGSLRDILRDGRLNHQCRLSGGVLGAACSQQLKAFFAILRA